MTIRSSIVLASMLVLTLALGACASYSDGYEDEYPDEDVTPTTAFSIRLDDPDLTLGDELLGWIYARDNLDDMPNRCIYIWRNGSWTLADETTPGFYDSNLVRGNFSPNKDGEWESSSFPWDLLTAYRRIYSAGHFSAIIGDRAIARQ